MKKLIGLTACIFLLGLVGIAHASLSTIGTAAYQGEQYSLIYDDDLQLTWLDYSHQADTWDSQDSWARGLNDANGSYGDVFEYDLFSGVTVNWEGEVWRLPDAHNQDGSGPRYGFNVTGSEMGHLFYTELGLDVGIHTADELNASEFDNLVASWYWSGTEYADNQYDAWYFDMYWSNQDTAGKNVDMYGLAVRSGQVSTVPVPGTIVLLASGLVGLGSVRTRRNRSRC